MSKWRGRTYYLTDEIDLREFVRGVGGFLIIASILSQTLGHIPYMEHTLMRCVDVGCGWNWVLFHLHIPQNQMYHWFEWVDHWNYITGR